MLAGVSFVIGDDAVQVVMFVLKNEINKTNVTGF